MTQHRTGTREEWLTARKDLLEQEKELTRRSDELARQRLGLPRHERARPPGGVGGLARGLPADPSVWVVELPRRVPGGHMTRADDGGRPR